MIEPNANGGEGVIPYGQNGTVLRAENITKIFPPKSFRAAQSRETAPPEVFVARVGAAVIRGR